MRQADLAERAGMSREMISRVERGALTGMQIGHLVRIVEALGGSVAIEVRRRGEQLDRLVDAAHAAIESQVASLLTNAGWLVQVEVSFNRYGERGRCDIVALHRRSGIMVVVEVKSRLGDLQETLGRLDVKRRIAGYIAGELGWSRPTQVVPCLVIGDSRAARRLVKNHAPLFRGFATRGRSAIAWIRRPAGSPDIGLLWFQADAPSSRGVTARFGSRVRKASDSRGV